jgi:hypothetical protein
MAAGNDAEEEGFIMGRKLCCMAGTVVGHKGSSRRRWAGLLSLVIAIGAGMVVKQTVMAVHDRGVFELDRNAINGGAAGQDWDDVFAGTETADASVFVPDGEGPTIFIQGGSKDDLDTTNWLHTNGSVPDKDELLDAFAARYGDILYFGADRTANNGDAQMGFWFFQQDVRPQPDGTFGPGQHEDGDLLILSDFSGGGGVVTIRVFRWNGPGGSIPGSGAINGTLDQIAGALATPADCVGPPSVPNNDSFCATVNTGVETAPWPFDPKVGAAGFFQRGEFYEGGIDLNAVGLGDACFASFLAETRSSTSVDAQLKDFVGGIFEHCQSGIKTTPVDANGQPVTQIVLGDSIRDHALVTGTGSSQAPTGTVTFFICAPGELTNGACPTGGTSVSTNALTPIANTSTSETFSAAFTPDEPGTWCWRGEYSGDANYPAATDASTGECFQVIQLQPTIATAQTFSVFDTAVITVDSPRAGDLNGTVVFQLFVNDTTCAGTPVLTTSAPISGPSGQQALSGTYMITLQGTHTLSWKVVYTSANPGHKNVTSTCHNENATLTFTNGVPQSQ